VPGSGALRDGLFLYRQFLSQVVKLHLWLTTYMRNWTGRQGDTKSGKRRSGVPFGYRDRFAADRLGDKPGNLRSRKNGVHNPVQVTHQIRREELPKQDCIFRHPDHLLPIPGFHQTVKEGFFAEPESGAKLIYGEHDRLVKELITWERWFQPAIDKHNLSSIYRYRLFPWERYEGWISKQQSSTGLPVRVPPGRTEN
jgi:hypothetical protein